MARGVAELSRIGYDASTEKHPRHPFPTGAVPTALHHARRT
jgi:hypothetical protein